jgi:LysR family transcriptional regulator for metE and metH
LLPAARRIIADIESAELDIASHLTGEKGELKVGTQCIFCYKWLPRVLSALQEKFPRVDLSVGNCSDTGADLDDAKFDVVISGAAARDEKYTSVALFADHMVCVMHSDHELASRNYGDYADFNDFSLITHAEKAKNRFYLAFLQKRGVEPQKVMAVGAPQAILEMVVAGFGIAIFPKWAIAGFSELYPLVYKPISAKGHPMTWHAIYPQQAYQPLFLTEFLRIVRMAALVEPSTAK